MYSFYSIIQLCPNPVLEDKISIGIVYFNGEIFQVYCSLEKVRLGKKLLSDNSIDIKFFIKQLEQKIESLNKELNSVELFDKLTNWTDSSYFSYLNTYSHGLIQFSAPVQYKLTGIEHEFEKLVQQLLKEPFTGYVEKSFMNETESIIQKKLIERVNHRVHTNYRFSPLDNPSFHFNYELDCIGKNGALIGAKAMSFDQSAQTIEHKLSNYCSLILLLTSSYDLNLKNNNFYLLTEEPTSTTSKEHRLWEAAVNNELINVLDPQESNRVAEMIEETNAQMFL
ncbi:MAG: hypothetical protein WBA16_01480 [Nonlabens sp.]